MITLPLTSDPNRTFTTVFGEAHYRVTQRWNERSGVWLLDLADADTEEPLVSAMPVLLGADLLASFCPRLGTMLAIDTAADVGVGADAGPDDLGTRVQVVWLARGETP